MNEHAACRFDDSKYVQLAKHPFHFQSILFADLSQGFTLRYPEPIWYMYKILSVFGCSGNGMLFKCVLDWLNNMPLRLAEAHAPAHMRSLFSWALQFTPNKNKNDSSHTHQEDRSLTCVHLHHNTVHMALQWEHQWRERGQPPWRYPFGPQLLYVVLNQISMHHVHVHVVPDRTQHLVVCSSTNLAWSAPVLPH